MFWILLFLLCVVLILIWKKYQKINTNVSNSFSNLMNSENVNSIWNAVNSHKSFKTVKALGGDSVDYISAIRGATAAQLLEYTPMDS